MNNARHTASRGPLWTGLLGVATAGLGGGPVPGPSSPLEALVGTCALVGAGRGGGRLEAPEPQARQGAASILGLEGVWGPWGPWGPRLWGPFLLHDWPGELLWGCNRWHLNSGAEIGCKGTGVGWNYLHFRHGGSGDGTWGHRRAVDEEVTAPPRSKADVLDSPG